MGLLQLQILSLMASDGPAVMTGAHSGVTVHLKLVNSQVITFHCFGYKLALPYTDITSDNSYIKNIKLWLKQQWKMFETHNSGWQCIWNVFRFHPEMGKNVECVIKSFSSNKAPGHDKISVWLLKDSLLATIPTIASIMNNSFHTRIFARQWKIAGVTPVLN